jgi:hypothetical protein
MNNCEMQKSFKIKEIMKKSQIITILIINLHVYEELNCLISDWASHSMNNNIVYEESFNSTKKACVSRETNNTMIEKSTFLLINLIKFRISYWSQAIINNEDWRKRLIISKNNIKMSKKNTFNKRIACKQTIELINKQLRFMKT